MSADFARGGGIKGYLTRLAVTAVWVGHQSILRMSTSWWPGIRTQLHKVITESDDEERKKACSARLVY